MRDLGVDARWALPRPIEDYPRLAHVLYEALVGGEVTWTLQMADLWRRYADHNARLMDPNYDFVIVHDPQPLPILDHLPAARRRARWIWHCHLDVRDSQPAVWELVHQHLAHYSALVLEQPTYAGGRLTERTPAIIPAAIDPLSPRNVELPSDDQERVLRLLGLDPRRPMLCQVSRIDRWTDPMAAIELYLRAKPTFPDLQLVVLAQMGPDTGSRLQLEQLVRRAGADPDAHVLSSLDGIGEVETNILQRAATIDFQRGVRKGFATSLLDASWKGRPVVAGMAGELPNQIQDGTTGYLAATIDQLLGRVVSLLLNPELVEELGSAGRRMVQERFLVTRYLEDYFRILAGLGAPVAA